jgi:hypothetical protein
MSYPIGTHFDFTGKSAAIMRENLREVGERIVFVKVFSEEFKLSI